MRTVVDLAVVWALIAFGGVLMVLTVPLWILSKLRSLVRRVLEREPDTMGDPP